MVRFMLINEDHLKEVYLYAHPRSRENKEN